MLRGVLAASAALFCCAPAGAAYSDPIYSVKGTFSGTITSGTVQTTAYSLRNPIYDVSGNAFSLTLDAQLREGIPGDIPDYVAGSFDMRIDGLPIDYLGLLFAYIPADYFARAFASGAFDIATDALSLSFAAEEPQYNHAGSISIVADRIGDSFARWRGGATVWQQVSDLGNDVDIYQSAVDFTVTTADVTVTGLPAVPEPATWAMMIGGFGLVGGIMRARRYARSPRAQHS